MEIILSKQCLSLTGMLRTDLGYHIQKRKNGFFAKRNSNGTIPPDGHLRFIFLCAELAQNKLHITDIKVSHVEFYDAVREAGMIHKIPAYFGWNEDVFMNAAEVLQFKKEKGL